MKFTLRDNMISNATYILRIVEGCPVVLYRDNPSGNACLLEQRRDLFEYSGGFAWGYGGTGPLFLAISILAHHLGEDVIPTDEQRKKMLSLLEMLPSNSEHDIESSKLVTLLG